MEIENAFFDTSDFILQPTNIRKGVYGKVYVAENVINHQKYAAKIFNTENIFRGRDQMLFLRESLILQRLNHPAILKFIGINFHSFLDPKLLQPTIITEYMHHGSLKYNLQKEKSSLSDHQWTATKKFIHLLGISDALRYLHGQGIAHRDLKPENILVDDDFYPRVCDFGLSKCFSDSLTKSTKLTKSGQFGTPLYLPPEILLDEDIYDQSVDVYAFGMIAYEIVTGKEPFSELGSNIPIFSFIKKVTNGYRPKFPTFVNEKMQNLICKCWSELPKDRPTFKEIFEMLSSDLTYFNESVDEEEIQAYIDMLLNKREEQSTKKSKTENNLKKEVEELKSKLSLLQNENNSKSDESLYEGLVSLFNNKNEGNSKKALMELIKSSEENNSCASFIIGLLYENGYKVEQNIEKSLKYYELSSKQGNSNGFTRIGFIYQKSKRIKSDYSKAKEYYEKAAELDNSKAQFILGVLYELGKCVEKDYFKAREYYEKSASNGNANAFNNLGLLYRNAKGVEQDYLKAKEYFEKGAELGHPKALNNLGLIYQNGEGVEQDYSKARLYYEKAAELGNVKALISLGASYEFGQGVSQDYSKAKEYYKKAADLDNEYAKKRLTILNDK